MLRVVPPLLAALSMLCCTVQSLAEPAKGGYYESYLNRVPPELVSETSHWVNTNHPLTLANLRGKVVWLQFNF